MSAPDDTTTPEPDDAEGHRRVAADGGEAAEEADDTQGHVGSRWLADGEQAGSDDDDTEGHRTAAL